MSDGELAALEDALGLQFKDRRMLERAVTHSSFRNENPNCQDNERLEFLGDAVLGAIVSELLWQKYPHANEGFLTRYKAVLVQEQGLVPIADALGLGKYLRLGKGEDQTGGRTKPSLLSDAVEAVVAATYVDLGYAAAKNLVTTWYNQRIEHVEQSEESVDFKSKLQELTQRECKQAPSYAITAEDGPSHCRLYTASVSLGTTYLAEGKGSSKKAAEQSAAEKAFHRFGRDIDVSTGQG